MDGANRTTAAPREHARVAVALLRARSQLAAKAALAAGIAWQLALLFPDSVSEYAYYAPLGALLAIYPTVTSSLHAAGQTVLGILLGATIALGVDSLISANAVTVALVVGVGMLAGALRWLGEQRSWVPVTALFVFTIGDPGSPSYIVGYVVLTLVGATVGTLVNFLLFPPLHLRSSDKAVQALEDIVTDQLNDLADGLEQNEQPNRDSWERRTRDVSPVVTTMHEALADLDRSARGNPRAKRHREDTAQQERLAQAFHRMALLVEDLVNLLAEVEQNDVPALPFRHAARLQCADAMRRIADLARAWAEGGDTDDAVTAACESLESLERSVAEDPTAGGADPFVAGSVVTTLRRCLGALVTCGGSTAIARNRSRLFR